MQKNRYGVYLYADRYKAARAGGLKNLSQVCDAALQKFINNAPVINIEKPQPEKSGITSLGESDG